jgi:hypothetical protein
MVNKNELEVLRKYERNGWKVLRGGAPDFLMLKVKDGKIADHCFVEVKRQGSSLTYEQEIYRKTLKELGAKYIVEVIEASRPNRTMPDQSAPAQTGPHQTRPTQPMPDQTRPSPSQIHTIRPNPDQTSPKEVRNRERDEG